MGLRAELVDNSEVGYFRIYVTPPGGAATEITTFRGAPVKLTELGTQDPFGETTASIELPQVTIFDRPGQGDLDWMVPYANVDIVWQNVNGYAFSWSWEGFLVDETLSIDPNASSVTLECKGALYRLDNYLAKPQYPQQPIPYELLIQEAFDPSTHPGSQVQPLRIVFPDDWKTTVPEYDPGSRLWFLKPWGVTPGQKWTGLTSRSTGTWEATLSAYVQGMLTVMFDEGGAQWTIRKDKGRIPVLHLRTPPPVADPTNLVISLGAPGVSGTFSRDFTQSANVIYGSGTDVAGTVFSRARVANDGSGTFFEPFAAMPSVYPDSSNPRFNEFIARKEVRIDFPNGMDELSALDVAQSQYYRFADPGYTGSITLTTDPTLGDGTPFPRMLIRGGQTLLITNFRGHHLLAHVTESTVDMNAGTATLTLDSKYRDQLTVSEVRARTRDALTPLRLIRPAMFEPTTQDMLMPWSYTDGSGCMPEGSKELFTKLMRPNEQFPWTFSTKAYPPKNHPEFYTKVSNPNRLTDPEGSWAMANGSPDAAGIPMRMAQMGSIRLSQVAAYDADGNVLPVRFHLSVYNNRGVGVRDMPWIPAGGVKIMAPEGANYPVGKANPFYEGAFEQLTSEGAQQSDPSYLSHESVGLTMGWGNYYEPAGYFPGLQSRGAVRSGLLNDEQVWTFDTTSDPNFDPQNPNMTPWKDGVGMLYVMIYCDDHDGPVYFLGRFFRQEPGTT